MKTILVLFLLLPLASFCQETDENDDYVLKGTTVLKWSDKYRQTLYQYGYYLDDIKSSDCESQGERIEELSDLVTSIRHTDSTINVTIKKIGNCTDQFLGEIEIIEDSIINLVTHGYGGRSTCLCCFGLEFIINMETVNEKVKFVMIDGNRETITDMSTQTPIRDNH